MLRSVHGEPITDLANVVVVSNKEALRLQEIRRVNRNRLRRIGFTFLFDRDNDTLMPRENYKLEDFLHA